VTEAPVCEKIAQGCTQKRVRIGGRIRNLLIASPAPYHYPTRPHLQGHPCNKEGADRECYELVGRCRAGKKLQQSCVDKDVLWRWNGWCFVSNMRLSCLQTTAQWKVTQHHIHTYTALQKLDSVFSHSVLKAIFQVDLG